MRLNITQNELEKLYEVTDCRGGVIEIKKKVLLNLLMDYSKMFGMLTDECGVVIKERDSRTKMKKVARVMLN